MIVLSVPAMVEVNVTVKQKPTADPWNPAKPVRVVHPHPMIYPGVEELVVWSHT
jgi:hypothetical protein